MRADSNDDVFEISEIDKIIYSAIRAAGYTPRTLARNKFLDRYYVYYARGMPAPRRGDASATSHDFTVGDRKKFSLAEWIIEESYYQWYYSINNRAKTRRGEFYFLAPRSVSTRRLGEQIEWFRFKLRWIITYDFTVYKVQSNNSVYLSFTSRACYFPAITFAAWLSRAFTLRHFDKNKTRLFYRAYLSMGKPRRWDCSTLRGRCNLFEFAHMEDKYI